MNAPVSPTGVASRTTASSYASGMASCGQSINATPRATPLLAAGLFPLTPQQFPISSTSHALATPPGYSYIQVNHHYNTPPGLSWLSTTPQRAASAPPCEDLPPLEDTPPRREPSPADTEPPQPSINATCHRCDHRREVVYLCHRLDPPLLYNNVKRCTLKFCDPCLKQLINKTQHVLLPSISAVDGWRQYYQSRNDNDWCCPRCHLFCDCSRCMKVKLPQPVTDSPLKPRPKNKMSKVHQLLFADGEPMNTEPTSKVRRHQRR